MSFASRLIPRSGSAVRGYFLVALGALALGLGGGCEDKHIGRPCNTNVADAGASGGSVAILTSPSLECPSRICLQAAPGGSKLSADQQAAEGAMCTASCSTDDDCSDSDPGTQCTRRLRLHLADHHRQLLLPEDVRLSRLRHTSPPGGIPEPQTCLSPSAGGPSPPTCQNVQ